MDTDQQPTPAALKKRAQRAKLYAAGKTCKGEPRRNRRFPDLHGLGDSRLWQKLYVLKYYKQRTK